MYTFSNDSGSQASRGKTGIFHSRGEQLQKLEKINIFPFKTTGCYVMSIYNKQCVYSLPHSVIQESLSKFTITT